ncbi:aminotransferase class V-fold PLP-dependent enzyme [Nocardioidaceae bacterium SCSIO 66511]|nr:aminotransferase class V-fold PLP-dependent enzyme [Nocardioidaceae bacterium SCSIO 66511]
MGRHYLQIPGPSNVPEEVLRATARPTIDHRGPEFQAMGKRILANVKAVFKTTRPVIIYPASGTGAWEAALVNTLSPGDRVLYFETGHFATLWQQMAAELGLVVDLVPGDWRHGVDTEVLAERLAADTNHEIKAVCCVHNETSTGVTSRIGDVRTAIDDTGHSALLLVDTISGLGSIDYRHDEWGVDVTIAGSQKGLMLPPGLGFNAVSDKALAAYETAELRKSYWDWKPILDANANGFWPSTPATNLLYGLEVALRLFDEEGIENVFARHQRYSAATRAAVAAWGGGLEVQCLDDREHSGALTAIRVPDGHDADAIRKLILERFDMSLGAGLSKVAGKVFRIGHLGWFEDLSLIGTLGGVQIGLSLAGVPIKKDGVDAAMEVLEQ